MKTYNITPQEIKIDDFSYWAVVLGEKGRGRRLVNVACPETFIYLEPGQTKTGKPRLNASASKKGWTARLCTAGAYIRGACGNVSIPPQFKSSVQVLAKGYGAFGAAGRTGNWDDMIIFTSRDDFWVRIKPSRGDAYIIAFNAEKAIKLAYEEANLVEIDLMGSTPTSRGNELVVL